MSEERQFQARFTIARNRWWSFRQRTEYQPTSYGMRYLLTTIIVGFALLSLLNYASPAEWWVAYNPYFIFTFLAVVLVAVMLGMRREDRLKRQLRRQAVLDFQRECPRDFTYNLL